MLSIILVMACSKPDENPVTDSTPGETGVDGPESYPSSYEAGKYRADTLVIVEDAEVGGDVDGDGEVDNKLPAVLQLVDAFVTNPLAAEDINQTLVDDMATSDIIVLGQLSYADGQLTEDILLGSLDDPEASDSGQDGAWHVDDSSFASDGTPNSRMTGIFLDETTYSVSADQILLPFPIVSDQPPSLVPLQLVVVEGTVDGDQVNGLMYGAIPVDDMMDGVIEEIIPTGEEYDPADYLNKDRDEFIAFVRDFANEPNVSDIEFSDGSRAISAALTFTAPATEW
ncbi:MAG: hypothetical protein GY913_02510 [Proteobacteria bacterium]|nr:hypothetical protein [Pseudomonadota bacterium]MCP4915773.1 hypothetical protein [Pseudomonadota bacterium]